MSNPVRRIVVVCHNPIERDQWRGTTRGVVPQPYDEVVFVAIDELRSVLPVGFEAYRLTPDAELHPKAAEARATLDSVIDRDWGRGILAGFTAGMSAPLMNRRDRRAAR